MRQSRNHERDEVHELDEVDNRHVRRRYCTYQARHGESLPVFNAGALDHHRLYRTRYMDISV